MQSRSYSKNLYKLYIYIYNRVSYIAPDPPHVVHRISATKYQTYLNNFELRPVAILWKQTARLYDGQGILGTSIGFREEAKNTPYEFSAVWTGRYMGIINDFRTDFRQNIDKTAKKQKCSKMTCQKYKCKDTAAEVRAFLLPTHTIYRIESPNFGRHPKHQMENVATLGGVP